MTSKMTTLFLNIPILLKFIYFEEAKNFCEIFTIDLSYVEPIKSTVEISQDFVAFSEYMNFTYVHLPSKFKLHVGADRFW